MTYLLTLCNKFMALFPSKLPTNSQQFKQWSNDIFKIYDLENRPNNSHALASLIMHLGPTTMHKSKKYFSLAIMKSMANEAAFETIQALRKEEEAYINKHMNGHPVPAELEEQLDMGLAETSQQAIN